MDLIAQQVLSGSAASVTFSSIPSTFRDLVLVVSARSTSGQPAYWVRLNGLTSGYPSMRMGGDGTSPFAGQETNEGGAFGVPADSATSFFVTNRFEIIDASATDKHKNILGWNDNPSYTLRRATRYPSTSAVTSVSAVMSSQSFAAGSTFYLYGIVS